MPIPDNSKKVSNIAKLERQQYSSKDRKQNMTDYMNLVSVGM